MLRGRWILVLVGLSMVVAGCSGGSATTAHLPTATASNAPTSTPATASTATPIPSGSAPTPTGVPAGWQVFVGPHFSIAYPPGWQEQTFPQGGTSGPDGFAYALQRPGGAQGVQVLEEDGEDAGMVTSVCSSFKDYPVQNFAGLNWWYSATDVKAHNRDWTFMAAGGTAYQLDALDLAESADIQAEDTSVLATFRAALTTPACA